MGKKGGDKNAESDKKGRGSSEGEWYLSTIRSKKMSKILRIMLIGLVVMFFASVSICKAEEPVVNVFKKWDFEDGKEGGWEIWPDTPIAMTVTEEALSGKYSLNLKFDDESQREGFFDKGITIKFDPPISWSDFSSISFRYRIDEKVDGLKFFFLEDKGNVFGYELEKGDGVVIGKPAEVHIRRDQLYFWWATKGRKEMVSKEVMTGKIVNMFIYVQKKRPVNVGNRFSFTIDDMVFGHDISEIASSMPYKGEYPYLAVAAHTRQSISIDGKLKEWHGAVPVALAQREQLAVSNRNWGGPADLSAVAMLLWDDRNLYFGVKVQDDKVVCSSPNPMRSDNDCIRLFLRAEPPPQKKQTFLGQQNYAFYISPFGSRESKPLLKFPRYGPGPPKSFPLGSVSIASLRTKYGYTIEMAIPWKSLGINPKEGKHLGFYTFIDDCDAPGNWEQEIVWRKVKGNFWQDASCWGKLLLTRAFTETEAISAAVTTGALTVRTDREEYGLNQDVRCTLDFWFPLVADTFIWQITNDATKKVVGEPVGLPPVKTPLSRQFSTRWNWSGNEDGIYTVLCKPDKSKQTSVLGHFKLIGESIKLRSKQIIQAQKSLILLKKQLKEPGFHSPESWLTGKQLQGKRRVHTKRVAPAEWSLADDPVTWEDLDGEFQPAMQGDMDLRSLKTYFEDYDFESRCYAVCCRDNVLCKDWRERWEDAARRNLIIFGVMMPTPSPKYNVIELLPIEGFTRERHLALQKIMGRRFLSYSVGEQDGALIGWMSGGSFTPSSRREAQKIFFDWHEKNYNIPRHRFMSSCGSINFSHQYGAMKCYRVLGLELAQALPSNIMMWAFLRGASKQYGILPSCCISIWNRWGVKNYISSGTFTDKYKGIEYGPDKGTSLSLMRRLYYASFLYGAAIVGFETDIPTNIFIREKDAEGYPIKKLSPLSEVNIEAAKWCKKHFQNVGVQHTPVGLLIDFVSGWLPPRTPYSGHRYKVWGCLDYERGDYQIDNFFRWIYPQYEDSSLFKDERGFLTATPLGDKFDVLTSNVSEHILNQYQVICLLGELELTPELITKLKQFVKDGGDIILSAAQAKVLGDNFCGIEVSSKMRNGYGAISLADQKVFEEKDYIYPEVTVKKAKVVAVSEDKLPLITAAEAGKGRVIVVMPEYWMAKRLKVNDGEGNEVHPQRYELLQIAKHVLGKYFKDLDFIEVHGPEIQYITNLTDNPKELLVTLVNNSYSDWQGSISLKEGRPIKISEWIEEKELPNAIPIKVSVPKGDLRVIKIAVDKRIF